MQNMIIDYQAKAAPGIIFPSKTFILNDEKNVFVISPCDLEDSLVKELKESSKKINFIAPNNFHNMFLKTMKEKFNDAQFFGPKRSAKVSGVDLLNTNEIKSDDIEFIFIKGCSTLSETCFYQKSTRTLFVTDLLFNMHHKMNLAMKMVMKLVGGYHQLNTSKSVKLGIKDKESFLETLKSLKALDIEKVVPSHGDPIDKDDFIGWADKMIQSLS